MSNLVETIVHSAKNNQRRTAVIRFAYSPAAKNDQQTSQATQRKRDR